MLEHPTPKAVPRRGDPGAWLSQLRKARRPLFRPVTAAVEIDLALAKRIEEKFEEEYRRYKAAHRARSIIRVDLNE